MKKCIVFRCLDNFKRKYSYAVSCDPENVEERIAKEYQLSTEIVRHEIIDLF